MHSKTDSLLKNFRSHLDQKKGQKKRIFTDISECKRNLISRKKKLKNIEEARGIVQIVAKTTQEQLQCKINDIVTLALEAVFGATYGFTVEFVIRRGKTEVDLFLVQNENKLDPMDASGGGVVDVCSFALRTSLLIMGNSLPILVLDEPGKFVSRDLQSKFGLFLKKVSESLGMQIIMVSHSDEYIDVADKLFSVELVNGVSKVG